MGTQRVSGLGDPEAMRRFTGRLLDDLNCLERLLEGGDIERGPIRIGAELEMFLVDHHHHPAPRGPSILETLSDERVTPELGAFNLEVNARPRVFEGSCLSALEKELIELLRLVRGAAAEQGTEVVLTGILPTLEARHASVEYMTPLDRYRRLNEAMTQLRGGTYSIFIKGVDELSLKHESVMLEACNTSFQVHLQVDPDRFARVYNLGLLATAPLLSVATNSPLLFGRRLWRETRIALFQQSIDTRRPGSEQRVSTPRVDFGTDWVEESVLEIYRDDVARFRAILADDSDPEDCRGAPRLGALQLFNSTVYRWLRPCYGVAGGKAHLRIENRVLPAGPTPVDQVANAAFWYGLLYGLDDEIDDPRSRIAFSDVRGNFFGAARFGLEAPLIWLDGAHVTARDLVLDRLLDVARRGLALAGVDPADAERYLGIIRARVESRQSGSEWMLGTLTEIADRDGRPWSRLTEALIERQVENRPVHEWDIPHHRERTVDERISRPLSAHMRSDLVTMQESDPVSLAIHLMQWKRIRHLPVEDDEQRLVGLVTRSTLFRFLAASETRDAKMVPISEIMQRDLVTAPPDLPVARAIERMRGEGVSSLPVVEEERLVGLVTERDFMALAAAALRL
ncbi:MAG: glutamate-cysteine ligase family protein, partial [Gemmatimonadota bacterium]|nr:glutamate-cysteine ligase family protein [Gemmatimonadota bacterium]